MQTPAALDARCHCDRVILALMALLLLYYAATPGIFQGKASGDGLVDFYFLPSVFVHRTLDLSAASAEARHWPMPVVSGRMTSYLPIGPPLAWAPLYLASLAIEKAARRAGALQGEPFGVNVFSYWMCGLAALLWSFAGILAAYRFLERAAGRDGARFGVVCAVLGTPLTWYLAVQPLYQHALSFAIGAIFVERWDAWRADLTLRRCLALGALAGAAALVRQQDVSWLLLPAISLASAARREHPFGWIARCAASCLAAFAVFLPQMALWMHYYGEPGSPLAAVGFLRWDAPSFVGVLFSTRAGLFAWSPILYLALAGFWAARRDLHLIAPLAAVVLAQLYVNASAWDWWGGWSFGARRFSGLTVVFALGLAASWSRVATHPLRRRALAWAAGALIVWNCVAMESVRMLRAPSTEVAGAAWERLESGGAPAPVVAAFRRVGWPFAWPASIPFALVHRVPVRAFEEVYGAYFCYRDYWNREVRDSVAALAQPERRRHFVSGFGVADPVTGLAAVEGVTERPARMLVPLFAREAMRVSLDGTVPASPAAEIRWNGEAMAPRVEAHRVSFQVPADRVRQEVNELELVLPPGARLAAVRFEPIDAVPAGFRGPPWNREGRGAR